MSRPIYCLLLVILVRAAGMAAAADGVLGFRQQNDRLIVTVDDRPLAAYVYSDSEIQRPYFAHVRTLQGVQVTRNHPPVEGQDRTDHPLFHPGVWLAFGDISGGDFWRNKAAVVHQEFAQSPASEGGSGGFAVVNNYVADGQTLCTERCGVRFDLCDGGYAITYDAVFRGDKEFYFGDQEEMGLGVRVATPLAVKSGGYIVDGAGRRDEAGVWGHQADWCDAGGTIDGHEVGVALLCDPANFRKSWFHARDYGLLVANPFGANAFTKGSKSRVVVRPGESLRLRFGVYVHQGQVDLPAVYSAWVANLPPRD